MGRAIGALTLVGSGAAAFAATPNPNTPPFQLCAAEQIIHDSNLFRLADGMDVHSRLGPEASRDDVLYRTSACALGNFQSSRQELNFKAEFADNRFKNNDTLDNHSYNGTLNWNWNLAGDWSGKVGGSYNRALAAFLNDRPLEKDLVTSYQYFGELRKVFGSHIGVFAGGQRTSSSHSASDRGIDEFHSNSGRAGVEYITDAQDTIGVDYQYAKADYPGTFLINNVPFDQDYHQDVTSVRVKYAFGPKTVLKASAGYLQRTYPNSPDHDYSGSVWRAALQWQPTVKTQLTLNGWRELQAYIDAESDHYLSKGFSLQPGWSPRQKIMLSALLWWEKQDYLSSSFAAQTEGPRHDDVRVQGADLTYTPVRYVDLVLSYRHERHTSDHPDLGFTDNLASLIVRGKFP